MDDLARQEAVPFNELWIIQSRPGEDPAERTRLMILYHEENLSLD